MRHCNGFIYLFIGLLVGFCATARADENTAPAAPPPPIHVGLTENVSLFFPIDVKTQEQFGSIWMSTGFFPTLDEEARPDGVKNTISLGISGILGGNVGADHAYLFPANVMLTREHRVTSDWNAFVGFGGGVLVTDLRADSVGVKSAIRASADGTVNLGLRYHGRLEMQASYLAARQIAGFNLSGAMVSLGVSF